jgi:hypothetical protein
MLINIEKVDEGREYLKNGFRILARIIVREELKKQSKIEKQTGTYLIEKKLLSRSEILSK